MGGSLLLQSFLSTLGVPMGFRPEGAIVARTYFDDARYPDPVKRAATQKEILARLTALPGVTTTAAASHLPLSDDRQIGFRLEHAAEDDYHWAENSLVSPGYFQTMGIRLVRGRDFAAQDSPQALNVAVVNEAFVRQHLPGVEPIGQRFHWGGRGIFSIVGVVADVHISALDADPQPTIYYSMFQIESGASARTAFVLRLARPEMAASPSLFQAISQQVWSLDKSLPFYGTTTLEALVAESVAQRRFSMSLMLGFAAVALLLAVIGLFGVVSFIVAQRTKELAVRIALGAERAGIGWLVLSHAGMLAVAGCTIGLLLFALSSPLFLANLFHVSRFDPPTMLSVSALLLGVAMLAGYWPARRAMRVDPMVALRYE